MGVPPGSRGVRLRVSGSGQYVAAVWPEHKCHALYRLRRPAAAPAGGAAGGAGAGSDVAAWTCELVESGPALDVAWSGWNGGCLAMFDDAYSASPAAAQPSDSATAPEKC